MTKVSNIALLFVLLGGSATAADYVVDGSGAGMHSSVQFKASHMGISALWGRFNDITGSFTYDADDLGASSIEIVIKTASIDSNHQARDTHLSSGDYLEIDSYPDATFVSSSFEDEGDGSASVTGEFSLHGASKEISFDVVRTGEGETPFGDYRVGFEGSTVLDLADFGINAGSVEIVFAIEGVRQ